jgi:hypothetical protein
MRVRSDASFESRPRSGPWTSTARKLMRAKKAPVVFTDHSSPCTAYTGKDT